MKTVTLYRHAKSDWKDSPAIEDFDRPLAKRGLTAAPKMGEAIRAHRIRPDLVLCSPAVRTKQTLALSRETAWDTPPPVQYVEKLYHAPASAMLSMIRALADDITHVMIVGHNPGLQELAYDLASSTLPQARELLTGKFPTAALASFTFDINAWPMLQTGTGDVVLYTTPAHLNLPDRRIKTLSATLTLIDNYDSFTYNLVHYFGDLGVDARVYRNDEKTAEAIFAERPAAIVMSPGPCTPTEAGICLDLIARNEGRIPLLGVCLGHQAIGQAFGGRVIRAPELMHGKLSAIHHDGESLFRGLPDGFEATRYHSLIVEADTLPACLTVTARTANGLIMGLEHKTQPTFGVQFHPESIASDFGHAILANFLTLAGISWTPRHNGIILPEPLTPERRRAFG